MNRNDIDINETAFRQDFPSAFNRLLRCHSRFRHYRLSLDNPKKAKGHEDECHIIWATDDYAHLGEGYAFSDRITAEKITGEKNGKIIQPRVLKTAAEQSRRVKGKAEVFTPAWVCNAQNNLVDEAWFGRKDVFNVENNDHTWTPTPSPIEFPDNKTWKDYVDDRRMEMCCGEAPYLVSRYDTVTGNEIPISHRIGLLDRKMRVVNENVSDSNEKAWHMWARRALMSTYGFEWQGDSLLLAREALLFTVLDFYKAKFGKALTDKKKLDTYAYIISWNLWQMDGLKMVVPGTCHDEIQTEVIEADLFNPESTIITKTIPCKGCKDGTRDNHNGIPCVVAQWHKTNKADKDKLYYFPDIKNAIDK